MLPKKYRLKSRKAFNATYKIGNSYYKGGITLFCGRGKSGGKYGGKDGGKDNNTTNTDITNAAEKTENLSNIPTKIGFVVSKKIHKRAVKRNRIKRLMREAVRLYIKSIGKNFDTKYISMIFVSSSKLLDKDFNYINKNIKELMETVK